MLLAASLSAAPIHYTVTGAGPRTVIFVPGWTCDETSWEAQVPVVSKTYRVVTVDLPGHGKSAPPSDGVYSIDAFARAVESVRTELKIDKVVLAGHSMGSAVVAQYAHLYPSHAVALVFVDGYFGMPEKLPAEPSRVPADFNKGREAMIRGMFSEATSRPVQEHILKMMMAPNAAAAAGAMNALVNPPAWGTDVLTLPIQGIYQASGKFGDDRLRNFHSVQIKGTGHFLMLEKPEEFNRILLGFLDTLRY